MANRPTPHDHVGGPKRRKVMRTTINDRGEEVTEEVWEDTQEASATEEQAGGAVAAQPQGSPGSGPAANSPAAKSPAGASEDIALKEQPGQYRYRKLFACCTVSISACERVQVVICSLPFLQPDL